jgi:phage antirepressor YoqD-like protein
VWEWYDKRDWRLSLFAREKKSKETIMATRLEHIKKVNAEREETTRKKIMNTCSGMFADEYRKKSGAWHIGKIAKDLNLTEKTVSKYLKEMERLIND